MNDFIMLKDLLATERDENSIVFESNGVSVSWQQWLLKVATWRQYFSLREEQCWGVFHKNAAECSAILFALWSLSKTACLLSSQQPAFLSRAKQEVDAFVGDFDNFIPCLQHPSPLKAYENETQLDCLSTLTLNEQLPLLLIYTSGSSGNPELIPKSLQQLSREVKHLHEHWGESINNSLILATVSHQHIYGLLFRILWPLCAGWRSYAEACDFWEDVAAISNEQRFTLISSPTHLTRIPASFDAETASKCLAIFSSGAPLNRAASLNVKTNLSVAVTEVFGSSETGGIAWREQDFNMPAEWQALNGVQLRTDEDSGCLEVRSQHLPEAELWYRTSDRVKFNGSSFTLLGRADRIVKIEGKRISLDEMEASLLSLDDVVEVRLLAIEAHRTEIAAAVVLSKQAQKNLKMLGKHAMNQYFRKNLSQAYERPLLPRRWRYLDKLPLNTQGKLSREDLMELFTNNNSGTSSQTEHSKHYERPTLPIELAREMPSQQQLALKLQVPEDLLFFDGHFEQAPILPGVVQLHWVEKIARQTFPINGDFLRMEAVKFQKVITPGQSFNLTINHNPDKCQISFVYQSESGQHSSGRILFSEAVPADG